MNTIKLTRKTAKIIAHRGVSGLERENTNAAFIAAGNRSYFGIETDVHLTADGEFIIIHDSTTGRVSDVDVNVEEKNLSELMSVQLNTIEGEAIPTRRDLVLPSPEEYISICKKYEKKAVLEIKNLLTSGQAKKLIDIVDSLDYLENTIFISFHWDSLVRVREHLPKQNIQFLTCEYDDSLIEKLKEYNFDLDIAYNQLTDSIIDKLHENGIKVNCWTVNDLNDGDTLAYNGVDFITTNILE